MIETFRPTSLLTSVLLPTLGLPTTAIKPLRESVSLYFHHRSSGPKELGKDLLERVAL